MAGRASGSETAKSVVDMWWRRESWLRSAACISRLNPGAAWWGRIGTRIRRSPPTNEPASAASLRSRDSSSSSISTRRIVQRRATGVITEVAIAITTTIENISWVRMPSDSPMEATMISRAPRALRPAP